MPEKISFKINDKPVELAVDGERALLWVLRSDLALTGIECVGDFTGGLRSGNRKRIFADVRHDFGQHETGRDVADAYAVTRKLDARRAQIRR